MSSSKIHFEKVTEHDEIHQWEVKTVVIHNTGDPLKHNVKKRYYTQIMYFVQSHLYCLQKWSW